MATVVTVMDREGFDANTDNIVVVQPEHRRVLWVPRDVWSDEIGNRINTAFALGGHATLLRALAGLGIPVEHSVCIPRATVEAALRDVTVTVRVREPVRLWYPLHPSARIEDGRKPVDFDPPRAVLQGERIHQWIGGRSSRDPDPRPPDLVRIRRQQTFVRALLRQGFDFSRVLRAEAAPSLSDAAALDDLGRVRRRWRFATADQVVGAEIGGMQVLVLRSPEPRAPRWRRRVRALLQ